MREVERIRLLLGHCPTSHQSALTGWVSSCVGVGVGVGGGGGGGEGRGGGGGGGEGRRGGGGEEEPQPLVHFDADGRAGT